MDYSQTLLPRNRSSSYLNRLGGTKKPSLLVISVVFIMVVFSSLIGWMIILASSAVTGLNYIDTGARTRSAQEYVGPAQASSQPAAAHARKDGQTHGGGAQGSLMPSIEILSPTMGQKYKLGGDVLLLPQVQLGPWNAQQLTLCVRVASQHPGVIAGMVDDAADRSQHQGLDGMAGGTRDGDRSNHHQGQGVGGPGAGSESGQGAGARDAMEGEREGQQDGQREENAPEALSLRTRAVLDQCMPLGLMRETSMHLRGLAPGQYRAHLALHCKDAPPSSSSGVPDGGQVTADSSHTLGASGGLPTTGSTVAIQAGDASRNNADDKNSLLASAMVRFEILDEATWGARGQQGGEGGYGEQRLPVSGPEEQQGRNQRQQQQEEQGPLELGGGHQTRVSDTDQPGQAAAGGPAQFRPSYTWQPVPQGALLPAGLEVRLPLDGSGTREARIPTPWQLTFYPSRHTSISSIVRVNVLATDTVQNVREAVAERLKLNSGCIRFSDVLQAGEAVLADSSTVASSDWFNRQESIVLENVCG